ncbi:unnamed protein product [Nezara viridula]|uniref:FAM20 C-terminal domain-containing protein n=1 Tax=Nezara viridula TaxID=85310 RepID=A0A9P0HG49_NEZVI|nr:unnamed protein product [Nezara viridula]
MYCHTVRKLKVRYALLGILLLVLINLCLFYNISSEVKHTVVHQTESSPTPKDVISYANTTFLAAKKIEEALHGASSFFSNYDTSNYEHNLRLLEITSSHSNITYLWEVAAKWITKDQITPPYSPLLSAIFNVLENCKIIGADVTNKGTQLKVLLTLEGNQKALFKPRWYARNQVIEGSVYAGKDRHNGEVAAFHIARLLGLNRAPIVTGRVVNLRTEILPVSSLALNQTFFKEGNNTCFYGVCRYCKREDAVCAEGDLLEGSITLWFPNSWQLKRVRHPWQRSYSSAPAPWEVYRDFCQIVKSGKSYRDESRLLDLVETSVFDFLIDNGDRHHYELFSVDYSSVLLIDNAKSFGNPDVDHIDILAPLYQCCRIREKLVARLVVLKDGALSSWLKKLLKNHILTPVLYDKHYKALNRRLSIVLAAIFVCFQDNGREAVLVSDD